jgi:hypothetical protein
MSKRFLWTNSRNSWYVKIIGNEPLLLLTDPNDQTYMADPLDGKNVLSIENPVAGEWTLNAEDTSKFTTKIEISWEIPLDYGFSIEKPSSLEETVRKPTEGMTLFCNFLNHFKNPHPVIKSILNPQDPKAYCRSFCQIQNMALNLQTPK